jgi:hypothetical protein
MMSFNEASNAFTSGSKKSRLLELARFIESFRSYLFSRRGVKMLRDLPDSLKVWFEVV